jgi:hypothetical protein
VSLLLLVTTWLVVVQEAPSPPSFPLDRVISVEIAADDPILEGHGPSRRINYTAQFSGILHAWTMAEGDLDTCIRIEDANRELLAESAGSGRKSTPYVRLEVEPGKKLEIAVAGSKVGNSGKIQLHLITAQETDATWAEAEHAHQELEEIRKLHASKDLASARARMTATLDELASVAGAQSSQAVADARLEQHAEDELFPRVLNGIARAA